MSNLKNEGYVLKETYYLPERVFFCNLYGYCRCKKDEFLDEIYTMMGNEIEEYISVVKNQLEIAEKSHGKRTSDTAHFLPTYFRNFVDKESKLKTSIEGTTNLRASNYLLSRCYKMICSVANQKVLPNVNITYKASKIKEDRETLDRFKEISESAAPLSSRDFDRIQKAIGAPLNKRTSKLKSYSDNQDIVVRFAIENVIPSLILRSQRPMLSFLASRDWHDVVCKNVAGNGIATCVISVNSLDDMGFSEFMNSCFEELKTIANRPKEKQDVSQVGSVLIKMYNRIDFEHKSGTIWGIRCDNSPLPNAIEVNSLPNVDNKKYEYDWLISTHILKWLDLYNFTHQDIPEFMESIDRVIDRIRPQVLAQIGKAFTMDEFRACKREGEPSSSLFDWSGCEDLLRLLLSTIRIEPIVFFKHHEK